MKRIINKLLLKLYLLLEKKFENKVFEDWYRSSIKEVGNIQVLTFSSKHKLDNAERTTIFSNAHSLGDLHVEVSVDNVLIGQKKISVNDIAKRVSEDHYKELWEKHSHIFTKMIPVQSTLNGIDLGPGAIECQTVLVKKS